MNCSGEIVECGIERRERPRFGETPSAEGRGLTNRATLRSKTSRLPVCIHPFHQTALIKSRGNSDLLMKIAPGIGQQDRHLAIQHLSICLVAVSIRLFFTQVRARSRLSAYRGRRISFALAGSLSLDAESGKSTH